MVERIRACDPDLVVPYIRLDQSDQYRRQVAQTIHLSQLAPNTRVTIQALCREVLINGAYAQFSLTLNLFKDDF